MAKDILEEKKKVDIIYVQGLLDRYNERPGLQKRIEYNDILTKFISMYNTSAGFTFID